MAGIYKLIMQRYELGHNRSQGLKMIGPPVVCKMREELHNDKPAYDTIDPYHSICWIKDDGNEKGGRWAHANLHAQKNAGIFEYKDSPRPEFGAAPAMSTTASSSQKNPFLGEWVRSTGFGGPETVFTLTAFPGI